MCTRWARGLHVCTRVCALLITFHLSKSASTRDMRDAQPFCTTTVLHPLSLTHSTFQDTNQRNLTRLKEPTQTFLIHSLIMHYHKRMASSLASAPHAFRCSPPPIPLRLAITFSDLTAKFGALCCLGHPHRIIIGGVCRRLLTHRFVKGLQSTRTYTSTRTNGHTQRTHCVADIHNAHAVKIDHTRDGTDDKHARKHAWRTQP